MEKNQKKIIIGIDPSMRSTGVCVWTGSKHMYYLISSGATKKLQAFKHPDFKLLTYNPMPVKGRTSIGKEHSITYNIKCILDWTGSILDIYKPDMVVIEACAFAASGRVADLSGLNHCIRQLCLQRDIPVYCVPPTTNKLAFTGNGQATKEMMIESWKACDPISREFDDIIKSDDIADAFSLAHFPKEKLIFDEDTE